MPFLKNSNPFLLPVNHQNFFMQSFTLPILLYDSEILFNSCTVKEQNVLLASFLETYDCDISDVIEPLVLQYLFAMTKITLLMNIMYQAREAFCL